MLDDLLLQLDELFDACLAHVKKLVELIAVEWHLLTGTLKLDDAPIGRSNDVHIYLSVAIFLVIEVQQRPTVHDAHGHRRHLTRKGNPRYGTRSRKLPQGIMKRHPRAGNRRRACAAIGLNHITVHRHGSLAQRTHVDHRA